MFKISFGYPGGKARMTKWLFQYFPKSGNRYVEPFCGLCNVFFAAKQELQFNEWQLNDLFSYEFLKSLVEVNPDDLPDYVSKDDFEKWKNEKSSIAKVIEPRITFLSKGYEGGYSGDSGTHIGYRGKRYRPLVKYAQQLLSCSNVYLFNKHWIELLCQEFTKDDFVYFDPPYFGTKSVYPNIEHEKLLEELKMAKYRWLLSGYENDLYQKEIGCFWKANRIRNAEMSSMNKKSMRPVVETIWSNFT